MLECMAMGAPIGRLRVYKEPVNPPSM
jgi:hypothetical protein